jgi:hypothetical protein
MKKITRTTNGIVLNAPNTATAKMASFGWLTRTTLAHWLNGSLGINNILFATALYLAYLNGSNVVVYGSVVVTIDKAVKNAVCTTITATATATAINGITDTAHIRVCYDFNNGNTARKKNGYIPMKKTENGYNINYIDNEYVEFTGIAIDIK